MFKRIFRIIVKEFIQVWRDKKMRFFLIAPPLVQLIVYGYIINFDFTRVAVGIFDQSYTMESRELISRFTSNQWFDVKYFITSQKELLNRIDNNDITMAIWIILRHF